MEQLQPTSPKPDGLSRVVPAWISITTLIFRRRTIRGESDGCSYERGRRGRVRRNVLWATAMWLLVGPTLGRSARRTGPVPDHARFGRPWATS